MTSQVHTWVAGRVLVQFRKHTPLGCCGPVSDHRPCQVQPGLSQSSLGSMWQCFLGEISGGPGVGCGQLEWKECKAKGGSQKNAGIVEGNRQEVRWEKWAKGCLLGRGRVWHKSQGFVKLGWAGRGSHIFICYKQYWIVRETVFGEWQDEPWTRRQMGYWKI